MKNSILCAAATTLILLSGCSADEMVEEGAIAAGEQSPSEVEIKLSAPTGISVTRAAIVGEGEQNVNGLGVFSLARELQDANSPQNVSWFGSQNLLGCILSNVEANKVGNAIEWADPSAVYFYPSSQVYSYDFYGYYPYLSDDNITYEDTRIVANYAIDGSQDLIWGRATSKEQYAYSAKYYRENTDALKPNIALKHLLTRFVFTAVPGTAKGSYKEAVQMRIDAIQIVDTYTNLAVTIADHSNLDMALADRVKPADEEVTGVLTLRDADGEVMSPVTLVEPEGEPVPQQLGESLMLYPQDRYTVRIVLSMEEDDATGGEGGNGDGSDGQLKDDSADEGVDALSDESFVVGNRRIYTSEIPLELLSGNAKFEQGVSYNVKITVHGPKSIGLTATLTPWEEKDGPTIEL